MKPNWTLVGRGALAALIFINAGLGTLKVDPKIEAFAGLVVGASIAFLGTILPQPLAILRLHIRRYMAWMRSAGHA